MKKLILIIIIFPSIISCEKTVQLNLKQVPSRIVIEGLVTNQPDFQYVKVSRSLDFYTTGKAPRVSDAVVTVADDEGNVYPFIHNPNDDPDKEGFYYPVDEFVGEVGRTYTLTVEVEGETYEATDHLYSVVDMDSLTYGIDMEEFEDPEDPGYYYAVYIYSNEPQETVDYYLFKFLRNDEVIKEENEIYFADDKTLGERIDGVQGAGYYMAGDTASVQAYSLSRAGYVYYSDISNLLNSDGGMFGPPPANSRTNLSNGALGFFQASAVSSAEIIIKE